MSNPGGAAAGIGNEQGGARGGAGRLVDQAQAAPRREPRVLSECPVWWQLGYGGLRVVSRDAGNSWSDTQSLASNGADDEDLLRAVAYGSGLWLAMGWKFLTSQDGVTWEVHGMISDLDDMPQCNIVEGLTHDGAQFYAACTPWQCPGQLWRSVDGIHWQSHAQIGDTEGHLFLDFRAGKFLAYGDSLKTFTSADALAWQVIPGVERGTWCDGAIKSEADCHGSSWFDGVYLRSQGKGEIGRSADGASFSSV